MYRQGLGDCFLITIPRAKGDPYRIMIDCGVILGTEDAGSEMNAVLDSIIKHTGGKVDLLVVTHEHWDHVSGFHQARDRFATPKAKTRSGKLSVGAVWFAWTEDPKDELAQRLRKERNERINKLTALLAAPGIDWQGLDDHDLHAINGATELLEFFGDATAEALGAAPESEETGTDGTDGLKRGSTGEAMAFARSLAPEGAVRYRRPGDPPEPLPGIDNVRVYVLGPPPDEDALHKTDSTVEVYRELAAGAASAFLAAEVTDASLAEARDFAEYNEAKAAIEASQPFDRVYRRRLAGLEAKKADDPLAKATPPDSLAAFLDARYYGRAPDQPFVEQSWRRIDGDWLGAAAELALALDSYTNNTSLALAFELLDTRKVLLFVADAQVGNWLSWQDLKWQIDKDTTVTGPDLLKRTIFYKVGHHGSHNATLSKNGLELMPDGELVAFIPVNEKMAKKKRWNHMPLPGLVKELEKRARGRVVRIDEHYDDRGKTDESNFKQPIDSFAADFFGKLGADRLYYEWTLPPGK